MKAVIELTCCRTLFTPVPVAESYCERVRPIVCVPVPFGSNQASPVGTAMLNFSAGVPVFVRSTSWSRNCPQA